MAVTPVAILPTGSRASTEGVIDRSNLTRAQFLMWLGQELDPDVALYNMIQTFRIAGAVDPTTFRQAWRSVVDASDALRSTVVVDDGVPMRAAADTSSADLDIVDLRGTPDSEVAARDWIDRRRVRQLVLDERLWDSALLILADDVAVWYLCMHHLITDGQAFALTYQAMNERYALEHDGRRDDAPTLPQYADYVEHEREFRSSERSARSLAYWRDVVAEPLPPTEFYGRTLSHRSTATDRLVVDVDERRSTRLREIAASPEFASLSEDLSVSTLWASVLFATLHRVTGRTALRVGSPFLGRPSRFRDTIGLFIEIGVLQVEIEPEDTFVSLGTRVLRGMINGVRHARPGVSSADLNRSYDVLLNNVTSRFDDFAGWPVTTEWVHTGHGDRDHALRLQVSDFDESVSFRLHFDVNAELFGDVERGWLLEQFDAVLDAMLDDPTQRLGAFDLVPDEVRHRIMVEFNDTDAPYPNESSVISLFDRQVAATADAVAAQDATRSVTYRELAVESQAVAAALIDRGVAPGDLVAVYARRSVDVVAGILGVLRTGAAYVPIDPSYPADRRRFMLADASASAIVVAGVDVGELGPTELPLIDVGSLDLAPNAGADLADLARGPEELAYVIYTSGSTGTPKGTELTHQGLVNYVCWAKRTYQSDGPIDFPLYSSLAFDLTITSLFVPLVSGGRIVIYDRPGEREGLEIIDVMEDDRVDIVKLTPAHLSLLLESKVECRRISRLIVGGENFRTDLAVAVERMFPDGIQIFNEYGPTEAVVGCMVHRFDPSTDSGASVPIGSPAANARIYVLDHYDHPVPPGVVGEMVVSSDGVAVGYRNRPELTADRFGDDPFRPGARWYRTGDLARWGSDGRLEFLGRNDHQVKIRGARIETGEIEASILTHPDVNSAFVDVMSFGEIGTEHVEHCATCGLPSNYPDSDIDDSGDCADCRLFAIHRDDVDQYFRTPADLQVELDEARTRCTDQEYDCVVLVSGGKDSTYMLYQLVRNHGVRPLVFTLDNGFIASTALDNVRDACADLGVDLHVGGTPHMNAIFADSLDRHANVCDGCYKTIYTLSMSLAREHGIDTIVTGLSRGQLFETRLADTFAAGEFDPDRIDAWVMEARKAYHQIDDAVFELLETELFEDDKIFEHIGFIDYYRYVDVDLDELYGYLRAETVWTRPPDTGRSTNCLINDVGIYVHNKQRGYHNYALPYSWDVRLGHKRRAAAMDELDDELDLERVRATLEEVGRGQLFDDLRAERRLVAYYTSAGHVSSADLRHHLAEQVPEFMVPSYLVRLDDLPLTVNGKVDRDALPDPRAVRQSDARYRGPRTQTERRLVEVWRDALRVPTVGVDDNFFDLGGDSITSIQIVAAIRQHGWPLTARDVFSHQTIAELASVADQLRASDDGDPFDSAGGAFSIDDADLVRIRSQLGPSGGIEGVDDIYPLTPTQLGMLYHTLRTSSRAYFGQGTCTLDGDVDPLRLRDAWEIVSRRHPATRVRFLWTGLETPVQVVQRDVELPWEHHDWSQRPADECRAALDALLRQQRDDGFDLTRGLLMDLTLVSAGEGHHLIWNSHHALLDGWSAHLLFDEVLVAYEQLAVGPVAETADVRPFRDHVQWQARQDVDAGIEWWQHHLDGIDSATPIPFDAASPLSDGSQGHVTRILDADVADRVEQFAREQRVTLNAMATAAWSLVLSRFGRADDVLFGSTVSGRENSVPEAARMVGMFISTLPTRIVVERDVEVGNWLRSIQTDAIAARRFGHVPLSDLQRLTGVPTAQPLFDSIVAVENHPTREVAPTHSLRPGRLEIGAPSNFALAILIHPGDEVRLEAVHEEARFSQADAERLLGYFQQALTALTVDARRPVGELEIVPPDEAAAVRAWSIGAASPPAERLVHDLIANRAITDPNRFAVIDSQGAITFGELDVRAREIAVGLRLRGVRRGDCVGLVAGTSTDHIAAILGVLRAGAVYVPIDTSVPAARLASMVDQTGLGVVIAERGFATPPGRTLDVVELPFTADSRTTDVGEPAAGDDLAYVIYTSGSTGTPKGVAVTHANLAHSTTVRSGVYDESPGTFLLVSSLAFDSSMVGLFWTLSTGGTLVLPDAEERHQLRALAALVERHAVTHLLALPSLYASLLDEHRPGQLASLRTVIVAGESCPTSVAHLHADRCRQAALYNEYGPTEATVWSHAHLVPDPAPAVVPIGDPIPNTVGLVLDQHDHVTPVGVAGELVIGGEGVAAGYLNRPDLTDRAFVHLPDFADLAPRWYRTGDLVRWNAAGVVDFVGRIDDQVKIRGYRVELSEIDAALLDDPAVQSAATVVTGRLDGTRRQLIGCYTAVDCDEQALRAALAERLPAYMVPTVLLRLDEMPTTSTDKLDRVALERLATQHASQVVIERRTATNELERTLVAIWSDVLGRNDIGVDDDFFELGGNSLDAMRMFARIERAIGREMLLSTLFEAPTIAELAALVDRDRPTPEGTCLVPIKPTGFKRPFFYVPPYEVSVLELGKIGRHFDRDRPFFGLQPAGLAAGEPVHGTVPEMAEHYVAAIKSLQPQGPYLIGGHCDGSWVAHEMARQLADQGDEVGYIAMVDPAPPPDQFTRSHGTQRIVDRLRYYARDGRLVPAIRWQVKLRLDKLLLLRFGSAASRRVRSVRIAHEAAFDRYEFEHDHRSPVHLVRSTELAVLMDEIPWYDDLGGREGHVDVTDISSTHARLLKEPETVELADVIGRQIDVAEAVSDPPASGGDDAADRCD